jgi:drug/metabolite transporter (DMT)-like permease
LQSFQPFMGLALAAILLRETVNWTMLIVTLAAVLCVAGSKKYAT